ncbi:MAG TPA: glycine--tRNA ligase subunit beta, partial [Burkholderiales bacterium]|nr:glycine--tRNA ligase subunit beta [Burkholderiales bacterium]
MTDTLLIEILTEELPPKSLRLLGAQFANWVHSGLADLGFLSGSEATSFATPRRLAVIITNVEDRQFEQQVTRKGPSVAAALNRAGEPTQALIGFAKSCGVSVEALRRVSDVKGEFFVFRTIKGGESLEHHLAGIVEAALTQLSIPKLMRWSEGNYEFARPVHGLIMLHGKRIVPGSVLGISSGRMTIGHRFSGKNPIVIPEADQYKALLEKDGKVIPHLDERFQKIKGQLREKAAGAILGADDDLIDEVTALVEYPAVYAGEFDPAFLAIPQECLVLSMEQHQRYFPLLHKDGTLLPKFLMVANVDPDDPQDIIRGNERVLRARLADAKFFFDQDRKVRLDERVPQLAKIVYHNKLSSQLARVERIAALTGIIAAKIGADRTLAERAAVLCKADLTSDMVGEFPELQGIMGGYYARHDGEPEEVTRAIAEHYRPRFSGDTLPQEAVAISVALADKLEALAGFFGIGQQPTGDKDPFA